MATDENPEGLHGAGHGIRTHDFDLGKVAALLQSLGEWKCEYCNNPKRFFINHGRLAWECGKPGVDRTIGGCGWDYIGLSPTAPQQPPETVGETVDEARAAAAELMRDLNENFDGCPVCGADEHHAPGRSCARLWEALADGI